MTYPRPQALAVLVAVVLLATGCPAAAVRYDSPGAPAPDPAAYEETLSPYGQWVDYPDYGHVWQPAVAVGWQPYVNGYWTWTPYGWTWVAFEPWGWTFHYGRWSMIPAYGWVWVPGTVWGPAWVDWYWGDGFVGWAPLGPFGIHVTTFNTFVFVRDHDFCSSRIDHVVVNHRRVPRDVVRQWERRDYRPPSRYDIERVSRNPVRRVDGRPRGTVAPDPIAGRPRGYNRGNRPERPDGHPQPRQYRDTPGRGRQQATYPVAPEPRGERRVDSYAPAPTAQPRRYDAPPVGQPRRYDAPPMAVGRPGAGTFAPAPSAKPRRYDAPPMAVGRPGVRTVAPTPSAEPRRYAAPPATVGRPSSVPAAPHAERSGGGGREQQAPARGYRSAPAPAAGVARMAPGQGGAFVPGGLQYR